MAITRHVVVLALSMLLVGSMAQDDKDKTVELALAEADAIVKEEQAPKEEATPKAQAKSDAENAHIAASTAKEAAKVATNVAKHSVKITEHAKSALKNAHDALHRARVDTEGLSSDQKDSLKQAEKKLREATKDAEYGQVKDAKYVKADVDNKKLKKLVKKMDDVKEKQEKEDEKKGKSDKKDKKDDGELEAMRKELEELRKKLNAKGDDSDDDALKELAKQLKEMEEAEKKEDKTDAKSHDEMKAEIEHLRDMIKDLEAKEEEEAKAEKEAKKTKKQKKSKKDEASEEEDDDEETSDKAAVKVEEGKSLDIDTAMPYGDLEPFGREDTAQELTESSIKESDEMVDQLERAEVAEEKRAVFRALTRLRGAAITSFDGVARSQTGNIDEYNKVNQWRGTHPLHHLADEESDVTKWAFPDNAD